MRQTVIADAYAKHVWPNTFGVYEGGPARLVTVINEQPADAIFSAMYGILSNISFFTICERTAAI